MKKTGLFLMRMKKVYRKKVNNKYPLCERSDYLYYVWHLPEDGSLFLELLG